MKSDAYIGAGTSLSSSYYTRRFYVSNRSVANSSERKDYNNTTLSLADSMALRRAIKQLGNFDYNDDPEENIRNSVLAYIQTYNNTLSSASDSTDQNLTRNAKQLKSIVNEYANDLDKIGITVNSDGSLTGRDLISTASISKFEQLFSANSAFMQRTSSIARRINRRSEELDLTEKNQKLKKIKESKDTTSGDTDDSESTDVAQLVAASLDLDTLLNTGIGKNVNIVL